MKAKRKTLRKNPAEFIKGYMVKLAERHEILYAVFPNGYVLTTGKIKYSTSFDKKGREWSPASLPENAEFIGNYPSPHGRHKNPGKKRAVTNRWGVTVHVGDSFKVRHVRGEVEGPFIVSKLETSGEYAKAYGPRVVFEHGGSASIDDLIVIPHSYKKNPSGEVFCYHCKKHITGKVLRIVPSNLHGQLLGDFGKSFHPACYKKAQEYLRKKNPARKKSRSLSVPETHQLKIARDTLKMHPAAVGVMGGPSHAEARAIIARLTGKRK